MSNKTKTKMIGFYDVKGKLVFALPETMTISEMVKLGFPVPRLVPKEFPQKENEARTKEGLTPCHPKNY